MAVKILHSLRCRLFGVLILVIIFQDNPCQHPVIIFRNVKFEDLEALVSFMYKGEVNVEQDALASFLSTAELLEVKGLTSSGPYLSVSCHDN